MKTAAVQKVKNILAGLLLSWFLAACVNEDALTPTSATITRPTGIYVLPNTNEGPDSVLLAQSFVDGWSLRLGWQNIETGPGSYDWRRIDDAIAALELQPTVKKLTLSIFALEAPADVLSQPGVTTYIAHTPPTGTTVTTAVPWDETALLRWEAFCKVLGDHPVGSASIPLRDHPLLAQLDTQIMGLGGLRDLDGQLVNTPGYTRPVFTAAVLRSLHAMVDNFPSKFRYLAHFNMTDNTPTPPLYQELLDTIMVEFNAGTAPKLGFFQENLGCSTPGTTTAYAIDSTKNRTFSMFQMIHSWVITSSPETNPCLVTDSMSTPVSGPDVALAYAYHTFGTRYFEIYRADLEHTGFADKFSAWHDILFPN